MMKDHAARAMRQLKISGVEAEKYQDLREDPDIPLRHFNIASELIADWHAKILAKYNLHAVQVDDGLWGVYDLATGSEAPQSYAGLRARHDAMDPDDKFADVRALHDAGEQGDIKGDDSLSEGQEATLADEIEREEDENGV